MSEKILEVKNLQVHFDTDAGRVQAVDRVGFTLERGETLGLVGESGCGKSVTNLALLGLIPSPPGKISAGEALFEGKNLLAMSISELSHIRGNRIAMIFQDPRSAMNPVLTIQTQITEVIMRHRPMPRLEAKGRAVSILTAAGLDKAELRCRQYPHELSKGQLQRCAIAIGLPPKVDPCVP